MTQQRERGAAGAACVTDRFTTLAAVMLAKADRFLVVHRFEVPEKRFGALLTEV